MTGEELSALIRDEIGEDKRLHGILDRIQSGKANLTDSELYTAITARITAQQMQRNVLSLDKREAAFVDVTRERYRDTFTVYSAVQRILDAESGIRIRPQEPGFDTGRARKIGHSLEDQTVPDSTIERRARSATENFCMSHHDDCMRTNAEFRARAGLQAYAIREGGAKCCDWCADVSGKYPANETPAGFWGRHDNCKCSILYESKRSGRQLLRGTSKKWEQVKPGAGAGELHRMTAEQVAAVGAGAVHVISHEQAQALQTGTKLWMPTKLQSTNFARAIDILNDYEIPDGAPITAQKIIDDLGTSDIGREILAYMENLPERIKLDYHTIKLDVDGIPIRGEEDRGAITIFLLACENTERASRTIIHECTHYRYNLGGSQRDECICFAQELKHKYKRNNLTYDEFRRIIKAVKDGYPQLPWKK